MMTEKQFIEMLKNIKKHCEESTCAKCKFNRTTRFECMLVILGEEFSKVPEAWNIKEIEELINE